MNAPRVPRTPLTTGARVLIVLIIGAVVSMTLLMIVGALAGVIALAHWIFTMLSTF